MSEDFFTDNTNNSNDSGAKYYAKIRWQDVVKNEAELKAKKAEEQQVYNEAYKEFEKLILEMEKHSKAEQPKVEKTFFDKFFKMFGFLLNIGEAEGFERQAKNILFKRKEEQEQIFSIIEFLRSLIKKILFLESGLSWQERLAKEIADLEKKLDDGTISKEQLQRLELLKCIEFLGPVNLLSALIKIVSVAMVFELGFTIGKEIAQTVENALSTSEDRKTRVEEMTDNLLANLLEIFKAPEIMKDLVNEAFLKSIPNELRTDSRREAKRINDTQLPKYPLPSKDSSQEVENRRKEDGKSKEAIPTPKQKPEKKKEDEQGVEDNPSQERRSKKGETGQKGNSDDVRRRFLEAEKKVSSNLPPNTDVKYTNTAQLNNEQGIKL